MLLVDRPQVLNFVLYGSFVVLAYFADVLVQLHVLFLQSLHLLLKIADGLPVCLFLVGSLLDLVLQDGRLLLHEVALVPQLVQLHLGLLVLLLRLPT